MSKHDDGVFALLLGMLLGGVAGGVAGILFAPKKGQVVRSEIKDFMVHLPDKLSCEMDPHSSTRQFIDRTRINIENQLERVEGDKQAKRLADAKRKELLASGSDYND